MNRRALKWAAAGMVGLALVALGVHIAWERHRYRLHTPKGAVRVGMTLADVEAVLGPRSPIVHRWGLRQPDGWLLEEGTVWIRFDRHGRARVATFEPHEGVTSGIPRLPLFEHIRAWVPGDELSVAEYQA